MPAELIEKEQQLRAAESGSRHRCYMAEGSVYTRKGSSRPRPRAVDGSNCLDVNTLSRANLYVVGEGI